MYPLRQLSLGQAWQVGTHSRSSVSAPRTNAPAICQATILNRYEQALGPNHPWVATSFNNLALLYYNQVRYAEAEPFYQRALAIWEKTLGPDHPNVATNLGNYAALLRKIGRDEGAAEMEARAKVIRAKHAEQNPVQ
jgi:tetratricopeptide (TPR) repeat protein